MALAQSLEDYLSLEVLQSLGQKIDPPTLEAEVKRTEQDTKAREVLRKIQVVYGGD